MFISPMLYLIHQPPESQSMVYEVHHSEHNARERAAELKARGIPYILARGKSPAPESRETLEEYAPE